MSSTINPIDTSTSSSSIEQKQDKSQPVVTVSNLTFSGIPSIYLYPSLDDVCPTWSFLLCLSGLRYSPKCHEVIHRWKHGNDLIESNSCEAGETLPIRSITESRGCCGSYYTLYSYAVHAMFIGLVMGLHAINNDYNQAVAGVPGMVAWLLLRRIFEVHDESPTPTFEHPHADPAFQQYYRTRSTRLYKHLRYIIYLFHAIMLAVALTLIVFFGIVAQRWSISILIWNVYTITVVGAGYIYFVLIIVILNQQTDTLLNFFQAVTKDQHYIQHVHHTYQACSNYVDRVGKVWSVPVAAACVLFIWSFIFGVREYLVKGSYGGLPWLLLAPFMFVCVVGPILWLNLSSSSSRLSGATLCLMLSHSMYSNADVAQGCSMFLQSMVASPIQLSICGITPTAALVATSVAGPLVALLWNSGQAFVTSK